MKLKRLVRSVRLLSAVGVIGGALSASLAQRARPAQTTQPAGPAPTVILDTFGFWRIHQTFKPPVLALEEGPKPLLFNLPFLDTQTASPPGDWMSPRFDDGNWVRCVAIRSARTPYLSRLCMRGRFEVTEPAKAQGLELALDYHGGAAVYLNGREIARANLPAGDVNKDTLADPYPENAFVTDSGELAGRSTPPQGRAKLAANRLRTLKVPLAAGDIRKGLNVLAIELVRSPYHKLQQEKLVPDRGGKGRICLQWNTCDIKRVQLTAPGADGLVPNATRPPGLQVWNSDFMMSDFDLDWGDPAEPLRPVKIAGARNGSFCGKVVVGSAQPIRGLKATAGDLKGGQGTIPASAVRIRYALPWGDEYLAIPYTEQVNPYPRQASLLSALAEKPLEEFPVREKPVPDPRRVVPQPNQPAPVFGAVVPVWVSVDVPASAKAGTYAGELRIEAQGEKPVAVPVELTLADWALPATQEYKTWVEMVQSPDTLAIEYGLEPWSDAHWKMIEQAFRYIGQTGSRVVHVPLIAQTNLGHEQTMVRWIRKGEGKYDHDFSVFEKYLDAAARNMGAPKIVCFWVWDIYLTEKEVYQGRDHLNLEQALAARAAMKGTGPMVTVLDGASGKTETLALPSYKDPASKDLWQPVLDGVRQRLKARGLEGAMMLGMMNDVRPSKEQMEFYSSLAPGVPWVSHSHGGPAVGRPFFGAQVGYGAFVWGLSHASSTPQKRVYGWQKPQLVAYYDRERILNAHTPVLFAHLAEISITGDHRGTGRLGADFWPVFKDKDGRRSGYVWGRYPHSSWRNLDLCSYVMAPSPGGPVATSKLEHFREGVQVCEARIFLERALTDKALSDRLGDDLAGRCQDALDEHQLFMLMGLSHHMMYDTLNTVIQTWRAGVEIAGYVWWAGSGWQERNQKLYTLAAEASARLGTR